MSTAGIRFGGLASGLDTKAIIQALVAIEERPIRALETKKAGYTKQKSLFGDLRGLLDKLTTAAKALKTTTDFLQRKASTDDEDIVTASASSSARRSSKLLSVQVTEATTQTSTPATSTMSHRQPARNRENFSMTPGAILVTRTVVIFRV